ncbi:hypothetical protein [Bradyrhizobium retamae]|nr:hypothetical protein [Bradyrhizobium retamae]
MTISQIASREQLERLITSIQFQNPAAVTLTLKKRAGARIADAIAASENFRHFRTRLESRVLGRSARRHNRRLPLIAVLEESADHRLHYHCKIDRPYHCSFERFSAIIRDQWPKTDFGYYQIDIQDQSDSGWTDYILKQRQKRSLLDSIDWANCHL